MKRMLALRNKKSEEERREKEILQLEESKIIEVLALTAACKRICLQREVVAMCWWKIRNPSACMLISLPTTNRLLAASSRSSVNSWFAAHQPPLDFFRPIISGGILWWTVFSSLSRLPFSGHFILYPQLL